MTKREKKPPVGLLPFPAPNCSLDPALDRYEWDVCGVRFSFAFSRKQLKRDIRKVGIPAIMSRVRAGVEAELKQRGLMP